MSHSHTFTIDGFGQVSASFNPDLSGEATIQWEENGERRIAVIPAQLLFALSDRVTRQLLIGELISHLETLYPS